MGKPLNRYSEFALPILTPLTSFSMVMVNIFKITVPGYSWEVWNGTRRNSDLAFSSGSSERHKILFQAMGSGCRMRTGDSSGLQWDAKGFFIK